MLGPTPKREIRKRNRPTVVCNNCRVKKTKCDRNLPCSKCEKLGLESSCNYDSAPRKKHTPGGHESPAIGDPYGPSVTNITNNGNHINNTSNIPKLLTPTYPQQPLMPLRLGFGPSSHTSPSMNSSSPGYGRGFDAGFGQPNVHGHVPGSIPAPNIQPIGYTKGAEVQSELESLRNKLKELEASITVASLHKPTSHATSGPFSSNTTTERSSVSDPPAHTQASSNSSQYGRLSGPSQYSPGFQQPSPSSSCVKDVELVGNNPYLNSEETINFFDDFVNSKNSQHSRYYKPLPIFSVAKVEPAFDLFASFKNRLLRESGKAIEEAGKKDQAMSQDITGVGVTDPESISALARVLSEKEQNNKDAKQIQAQISRERNQRNLCPQIFGTSKGMSLDQITKYGSMTGVIFREEPLSPKSSLEEKIISVLPERRVLWRLIDRFFAVLYPFLPIVDEISYRPELKVIIGESSKEEDNSLAKFEAIKTLKLSQKQDLILLGMTLVILRLSYLSLFKNNVSMNESALNIEDSPDLSTEAKDLKWLLSNPIPVDAVDVAELCLKEIDLTRQTDLITFQFMLFLSSYRSLAPEEARKPLCDTRIFNGLLVSNAFGLGLNRDPDIRGNYVNPSTDPDDISLDHRLNNLKRKLWHFLVAVDIRDSMTSGLPPMIERQDYDTRLPHFYEANENIFDFNLEMDVISSFSIFEKIRQPISAVLAILLNKSKRTPFREFSDKLTKLEDLINSEFGNFEEYLNPSFHSSGFLKILRLRLFLEGHLFLSTIFYALSLYYSRREKQNTVFRKRNHELSYFYLKKVILYSTVRVQVSLADILDESRNYVDRTASLFLSPYVQAFNNTSGLMSSLIYAKVNSNLKLLVREASHETLMRTDQSYAAYFAASNKLLDVLREVRKVTNYVFMILGKRFFLTWKIFQVHKFCYNLIDNNEFFEFDIDATRSAATTLDFEEITDLAVICQKGIDKMNHHNTTELAAASTIPKDASTATRVQNWFSGTSTYVDVFWQYIFTFKSDDDDTLPSAKTLQPGGAKKRANTESNQEKVNGESNGEKPNSASTISDTISESLMDEGDDIQRLMERSKGTPGYMPTPSFEFTTDAMPYDIGIFNGQSFEDFF